MPLAPPRSLSPSKVTSFTACPLAFRLRVIDRLPEPPSPEQVKGTLVHAALERLIWDHPPGERSPGAALDELTGAWEDPLLGEEVRQLELDGPEIAALRASTETLVANYFELEDPDRVQAVGVELGLEADLGDVRLRGILDRLDLTEDGELVVIDYKTGTAPPPRFEHARLTGVHLYALLCQRVLGRAPAEVRLLHLREPVTITAVPTAQKIRGQAQRTVAVWEAIERACAGTDFRPRPSALCPHCSFQEWCPAFGGKPPAPAEPGSLGAAALATEAGDL